MTPKPESTEQQPGADRFWGQFSQSKAGRTSSGEETATGHESRTGPNPEGDGHDAHCLEWCPICRSADLFRTAVSPELRQQAESIQHEAMGVLKAFLDAYAEKTAGGGGPAGAGSDSAPPREEAEEPGPRITDIPLD